MSVVRGEPRSQRHNGVCDPDAAARRSKEGMEALLDQLYIPGVFTFISQANGPVTALQTGPRGNLVHSRASASLQVRHATGGKLESILAIHEGSHASLGPVYILSDQGRMYSLTNPSLVSRLKRQFPVVRWVQTGGAELPPEKALGLALNCRTSV